MPCARLLQPKPLYLICLLQPHRCLPCLPPFSLGCTGKYVELKDTIQDFKGVLEGKYDDLPEMAFYMVRALYRAELFCYMVACLGGSLFRSG